MSDKSNFQYFIDGLKWLFGKEDKKCRFNDLEEVQKFVGKNINVKLVEKWFYIVDRREMFNHDKKVVRKYEEMIKHFELFVDSLFVINNYENDTDTCDKSSEYVDEFEELLKSFESIVCESISKKIDSERQLRSRIKSSKTN